MPPVWPPRWVGRIFSCRFTRLTPSTSTLLRPGSTRSTRPLAVMSLPAITITRSSLWIFMVLQHLWRETDDLHEALVPQLAAHRAEDARATRVLLLVDDDGSVLVEADVGAVGAALLLLGAHDDRLDHVAFLDRAARDGVLHRRDDDVADGGVASPGAAEHADAQDLLGTRVVAASWSAIACPLCPTYGGQACAWPRVAPSPPRSARPRRRAPAAGWP